MRRGGAGAFGRRPRSNWRRDMIKEFVYRLGSLAGAPRGWQQLFYPDSAAVLTYHAIPRQALEVPDWCFLEEPRFRHQMHYLRDHCQVVPLRDVAAVLAAGSARPVVALTFDDGFHNNYEVAFPILRELALPATIFLATDFVDSDDTIWFCRINDALARTELRHVEWDGHQYDLTSRRARAAANGLLQARLKSHRHPELLERTRELISLLGERPEKVIAPGSEYRMLASQEIREMAGSGLIDFGAHTCSHAILSGLSPAERTAEIAGSLAAIERLSGAPCRLFAYPNGRPIDYGPADVGALAAGGITVAVTNVEGPTGRTAAPLEMRRYGIGGAMSLAKFQLLIHHLLWKLRI
jgi:peptidoglycan/xylan/chitin deacetylase (PgdA/CDA1 family)